MLNLFSTFEPSSSTFNLPLNWLACLLGLLFIPFSFWISPSRWSFLWSKILSLLFKEMKPLLSPSHNGTPLLFLSLFVFVMFNNVLGLLPYVFTSTSHMTATLTLSLPLWITLMTYGWFNNTQKMFASLVPQSTPTFLMPFMVVIETISNVIRPLTLAVRLSANMTAGHLLLTILGSAGLSLSKPLIVLLVASQILLLTLEAAVAFIQSYVFAVLSTLYTSEIN